MKSRLRAAALEKRKGFNCAELSRKAAENLFSLKEYKAAKNIICYYSLKYEIDTKVCFEDKSKNWFLPKVNGSSLLICPFGRLQRGKFGILEPETEPLKDLSIIDMVIIPCCAADKSGYRLGFGMGYYDRFLPKLQESCIKAVLAYSELVFDTIYPDEHDYKCNIVITDKEIFRAV